MSGREAAHTRKDTHGTPRRKQWRFQALLHNAMNIEGSIQEREKRERSERKLKRKKRKKEKKKNRKDVVEKQKHPKMTGQR